MKKKEILENKKVDLFLCITFYNKMKNCLISDKKVMVCSILDDLFFFTVLKGYISILIFSTGGDALFLRGKLYNSRNFPAYLNNENIYN